MKFLKPSAAAAPAAIPILLVDDRRENLVTLEAILAAPDRRLVLATSGPEALKLLLRDDFALILLDVRMPGMDGFETATLIRSRDRTRHVPILFLSADLRSDQDLFRGYAVGAVDYVLKPVSPEILRSKVQVFVELARNAETIRRQAEDLARKNAELEAFSYTVSHDLRAPLRAIDGFSQALLEDQGDRLDDPGKDHLRRVRAATKRMSELIEDLLRLAQVANGELRRQGVDLSALARQILAELAEAEPGRLVETVVQDGVQGQGDPKLLRVALENLLGNAWKFTRKRDDARIEFAGEQAGDQTCFRVCDNGAGFDMSDAPRLFRPFRRLHDVEDYPGTGIGLATVQRIVGHHGGRVWVEATPDQGAKFFCALPAS